jgi:hypothetical protein
MLLTGYLGMNTRAPPRAHTEAETFVAPKASSTATWPLNRRRPLNFFCNNSKIYTRHPVKSYAI